MPQFTIDKDGFLLNSEGERVEIEGEAVQIINAQNKDQIEATIRKRLGKAQDQIAALEKQVEKTPELQRLLDEAKAEKTALEKALEEAKDSATREVASQINTLKRQVDETKQFLAAERAARISDQVTNLILSKAEGWINPAKDLVPDLLKVHKREPVVDEKGKPIEGRHVDLFEVTYPKDDGEVTERLPAEKALEVLKSLPGYQHYLAGSGKVGSGSGDYKGTGRIVKFSDLKTDSQKSAYITDHGLEAYEKLMNETG